MKENTNPLSPLLKLGEEKLTQLLVQLLANEGFVASLQGAISTGIKAKGSMDKGLMSVLSAFNVPSVEDVEILKRKMAELEEALGDLAQSLENGRAPATAAKSKKTRKSMAPHAAGE